MGLKWKEDWRKKVLHKWKLHFSNPIKPCHTFPHPRHKSTDPWNQQRLSIEVPKTALSKSSYHACTKSFKHLLISHTSLFFIEDPEDPLSFPCLVSSVVEYLTSAYQNHSPLIYHLASSPFLPSKTLAPKFRCREVGSSYYPVLHAEHICRLRLRI